MCRAVSPGAAGGRFSTRSSRYPSLSGMAALPKLAASQWISTRETPWRPSADEVSADAAAVARPRPGVVRPDPVADLQPTGADPIVQSAEAEEGPGVTVALADPVAHPHTPARGCAPDGELEFMTGLPVGDGPLQELADRRRRGRNLGPGHPRPQFVEAAVDRRDQVIDVVEARPGQRHVGRPDRLVRPTGQPPLGHVRGRSGGDGCGVRARPHGARPMTIAVAHRPPLRSCVTAAVNPGGR